jgi:hypothetical protein
MLRSILKKSKLFRDLHLWRWAVYAKPAWRPNA